METISQQTDEIADDVSPPSLCVKIWPYICPAVVAIVFVGLALAFALIYTGYGIQRTADHDTTVYCIRRNNDLRSLNESALTLADAEKYPYIGSLVAIRPFVLLCTVVVLNTRYVLTGANCFASSFPDLRVRVDSNFWDKGNEYLVERFIINDGYNGKTLHNNIALIKVSKNMVRFKTIQMAKLPRTKSKRAETGIMIGWNFWATAEHDHIKLVQQELMIWPRARCQRFIGNYSTHKLICASLNNSLCNLDITGPFLINGKLAGFWSWGLSCINVPSIFTDLFYFREWISKRSAIRDYN